LDVFEMKAATMKKHWILVANGSMARFFSRASVGDPLVALEPFDFPEGRLKSSELERERHGQGNKDNSSTVIHFEPHTSMREKLLQQFARELGKRLQEGVVNSEYESFWLIAPGPLLSEIKGCLNRDVACRLQWAHDADFTGLDVGALESRLRELHRPGAVRP
jgi:protein required for attachment to host cells